VIDACYVCASSDLTTFLLRPDSVVNLNTLHPDRAAAVAAERVDLELAICNRCESILNRRFDFSKLEYARNYDTSTPASEYFEDYMRDLILFLVKERRMVARRVLEIGSGKGAFLKLLVSLTDPLTSAVGIDESYDGPPSLYDGRLEFRRRRYGDLESTPDADVVLLRHVLCQAGDPMAVLRPLRKALSRESVRIYFETPSTENILEEVLFTEICVERSSYFTVRNAHAMFHEAGFDVIDRPLRLFSGQYFLLECAPSQGTPRGAAGETVIPAATTYQARERARIAEWRRTIEDAGRHCGVAIWGAGTKGASLVNHVDPRGELIDVVVDRNARKIGHFVAGTGHPIVAPEEVAARGIGVIFVMNANYLEEMRAQMSTLAPNVILRPPIGASESLVS